MSALPFFIFNTCTLSLEPDGFAENLPYAIQCKELAASIADPKRHVAKRKYVERI